MSITVYAFFSSFIHRGYSEHIQNAYREPGRRVVIGFNENALGEAVVTTGVPVEYKPDEVTYVKQKTLSYERHIFNKMQEQARRR